METPQELFNTAVEKSWQQPTPTQSEQGPSYSHGITQLLGALEQINALHLMFAGIYSEQLASFQESTGPGDMPQLTAISASFARLERELQVCIIAAIRAEQQSHIKQMVTRFGQATITTPTARHSN